MTLFQKLIPHIDAMIYVDADTLFLGPVEELWDTFTQFNISQMSAMALEDDNPNVSWYPRFAKHPFYGKYGKCIFIIYALTTFNKSKMLLIKHLLSPMLGRCVQQHPYFARSSFDCHPCVLVCTK